MWPGEWKLPDIGVWVGGREGVRVIRETLPKQVSAGTSPECVLRMIALISDKTCNVRGPSRPTDRTRA